MDTVSGPFVLSRRMQLCGQNGFSVTQDFVKYLVNFALQNPVTSAVRRSSLTCTSIYALNIRKRVMLEVRRHSEIGIFNRSLSPFIASCKKDLSGARNEIFNFLIQYKATLEDFLPAKHINFFAIVCYTCVEVPNAGLHSCVPLRQSIAVEIITEYTPGLGTSEYREMDVLSRIYLANYRRP